jgi:hypothetical protein
VSAVNAIGEGTLSEEQEIIAATVPHQPYIPTKKSASASWIEVEWLSPLNGGSTIRGYHIYKDGIMVVDTSDTSFMIMTDIQAGVIYQVSVLAYNDVGQGQVSDVLNIMAA